MKNGYKKDYGLDKKFFQHRDMRELLRYCADTYGEKTAFVTKLKNKNTKEVNYINTSYEDMFRQMGELGTALWDMGYHDKRIAIIGENSYYWVLAYMTCASGLGVTVPLDKGLQKEELESCINRADCRAIFYDRKHAGLIGDIMADGNTCLEQAIAMDCDDVQVSAAKVIDGSEPAAEVEGIDGSEPAAEVQGIDGSEPVDLTIQTLLAKGKELLALGDVRYLGAEIDPEAMSFLLFTSGTTEQSKAVMLSHKNFMSCNYGMNQEELFFPDDVNMCLLPLHHVYGFSGLVTFLSQGLTNVFCDGLKYVSANMKEYGVSVITSVPLLLENMYKKIMKAIDKQGQRGKIEKALRACDMADKLGINLRKHLFKPIIDQMGGRMRFFINGAAALDPVVQKGLNDFGILTVQGYGLTECAPTIASETYRYLRPGSCGIVMPNVTARIEDPDEEGIGELVVRGDNVMLGYYDNPEATAEVLDADGWFHTGDLAYIDEDGYLFISGRKKNVIVMKNGKNVFPEEMENLINLLPYVSESMVFTQNKLNDYVLWAKVVVDPAYLRENQTSLDELAPRLDADMEQINAGLPAYKMVKRYFLSEIPTIKTTTQKTKRKLEMKQIEAEIAERGLK